MFRKIASSAVAVLVCGLMTTASYGQLDGVYDFDGGGDGTSWDVALNWEQVLDPFGAPISGDPATPPDAATTANIPILGVVVDSAGQFARFVHVGTDAGAGSLSISSGDLTLADMRVGAAAGGANGGSLDVSGGTLDVAASGGDIEIGVTSAGTMTMSAGVANARDDFVIRAGSSLTMTGGSIDIGDRLVTEDDATLTLDGGDILADDDFFFFGSSQITVNGGSMIVYDKMRLDDAGAKVTINGGVVRSNEFGFVDGTDGSLIFNGVLEINDSGVYQVESPTSPSDTFSRLSVGNARALIAEGLLITTTETDPTMGLVVESVVVPLFDGRTDVVFTQISIGVVPEPTSLLLLSLAGLGLVARRKRA